VYFGSILDQGRFRTGKAIQSSKFANKNLLVAGSESARRSLRFLPVVRWFWLTPLLLCVRACVVMTATVTVTKNIKLDQLRPKMLLIPSFLLDNGLNNEERSWEPLIFHNVVRSLSDRR